MSRYCPKFTEGDVVQVISSKSKHKGMFGIFRGYTNGLSDYICRVEINNDFVFLTESSIKLITEKNIADIHVKAVCEEVSKKNMQNERNIDVKYEGKHIRIGVHKLNGNTYMQQVDNDIGSLWFRFEPEYYLDYEEYIKEYCTYLKNEATYPDLSSFQILDDTTLNHYMYMFKPSEVYLNHQCIYSDNCDVTYTKEKYVEDMKTHMIPNKYYPFINNVNISVDDTTKKITIHFSVTIRYEESFNI